MKNIVMNVLLSFVSCTLTFLIPFVLGLYFKDCYFNPQFLFMFWGGMAYHFSFRWIDKYKI